MKKLTILIAMLMAIGSCASYNELIHPSIESQTAQIQGLNDYRLCVLYFDTWWGSGRSDKVRYPGMVATVKEVDKREINCRKFPELSEKKDFMREWIKEYKKQI
jgi:hypothetical protein